AASGPAPIAALMPALHARAPGVRQSATIEIQVFGDVIAGQPVSIEFRATNPAPDANQGSITVSLSGTPGPTIEIESGDGARVYQPGEPMYSFSRGQNAPISVPAVELYAN